MNKSLMIFLRTSRVLRGSCVASAFVLVMLGAVQPLTASIIDFGSTYSIVNQNFPTNFTELTLSLDGNAKELPGTGGMTVREILTPDNAGEWIEFVFDKPTAPLATTLSAFWRTDIFNIAITEPAYFDGFFVYWTIDGEAVEGITTLPGLGAPIDNLIDPTRGKVYGSSFTDTPAGPFDGPLNFFAQLSNYQSLLLTANMNPNEVNGFRLGAHLRPVRSNMVPEPTSVVLWSLMASLGLCIALHRRGLRRNAS